MENKYMFHKIVEIEAKDDFYKLQQTNIILS